MNEPTASAQIINPNDARPRNQKKVSMIIDQPKLLIKEEMYQDMKEKGPQRHNNQLIFNTIKQLEPVSQPIKDQDKTAVDDKMYKVPTKTKTTRTLITLPIGDIQQSNQRETQKIEISNVVQPPKEELANNLNDKMNQQRLFCNEQISNVNVPSQ